MNGTERMAPCGIICADCGIYQAAQDPIAAERLAENWRASGFPNAVPEWFQCQGCWGDPALCWTEDCRIRTCCVDERGLASCADCADFPCPPYLEWANDGGHHTTAFERLKQMR